MGNLFGWTEEKQFKVLILSALLVSGFAYAVGYTLVGDEVVKTEVVDAPALALALGGEITSLNAEADAEYARYNAEVEVANELKAAADEIRGKYPNAAEELDRAYDDRLVEADTIRGLAVQYEELADEKQAELDALNAAMLTQAPKG